MNRSLASIVTALRSNTGVPASVLARGVHTALPTAVHRAGAAASDAAGRTCAVIGMGQIGSAVTAGLVRNGHKVQSYDPSVSQERAEALGASWAATPIEAAEGADTVITCLPAAPHVRAVMEDGADDAGADGEEGVPTGVVGTGQSWGLLGQLGSGTQWIDHTTTDHNEARRLQAKAAAVGVDMVEAPLTGGLELLKAGLMTVLVGGPTEAMERNHDLMKCYAETVLHMGDVGAASIVKVVTNQLAAVHLVAAGEALMLCGRQGIDLRAAFDGIRASAGNSYVFETEAPLMFNQSHDPGFAIALHCKDLDMGMEIAKDGGVPIELTATASQIYRRAQGRYGPDAGSSHPAKLAQDDLSHTLDYPGFDNWRYTIEKVTGGSIGVVHKYDKQG